MERLLARTARALTFFLVVPGAKKQQAAKQQQPQPLPPLASLACARRLLPKTAGGKGEGSPFLAWYVVT